MNNTTNEKINSPKNPHLAILKYIGILSVLTIIGFKMGGTFLENYMKNVGQNPINAISLLSSQEMANVQKTPGVKAGEIGYEFKIDHPMVIIHNYLPGADRGYGTEIALINTIPRKLVETNVKNIETSEKKNFKDASPIAEDLDLNNSFYVVNRIDVDGKLSKFHLYVLRDEAGIEYIISHHQVPWNR